MRSTIQSLVPIAMLALVGPVLAQDAPGEPLRVDTEGVSAKILFEAVIDGGHVPELVGKYKLRVIEILPVDVEGPSLIPPRERDRVD